MTGFSFATGVVVGLRGDDDGLDGDDGAVILVVGGRSGDGVDNGEVCSCSSLSGVLSLTGPNCKVCCLPMLRISNFCTWIPTPKKCILVARMAYIHVYILTSQISWIKTKRR